MNPSTASNAFSLAKRSFLSGSNRRIKERMKNLSTLRACLQQHRDELLSALYKDLRRAQNESALLEIDWCVAEINSMLKNLHTYSTPERFSCYQKPLLNILDDVYISPQPKGVVLIVGPWNYPVRTLIGPLIGAIAAGCVTVLKPSEVSAHTTDCLKRIISHSLPSEVVQVCPGDAQLAEQLVDQNWDHIFFTGNKTVGSHVMMTAAKYLSSVTLELGGKNPCIVDCGIDMEVACRRIAWGKFLNAGQTCVAPDYVLVHQNMTEKFIRNVKKTCEEFFSKYVEKCPHYGRIVNVKHFDRLSRLLQCGKVVFGGDTDRDDLYIAPTVIIDAQEGSELCFEEIFGPILPVISFASWQEVLDIVRKRANPLAVYLFTSDDCTIKMFEDTVPSGALVVNDVILQCACPLLPFGGIRTSGIGAYQGKYSFSEFSNYKSILKRTTKLEFINYLRYPPITFKKYFFLYSLLFADRFRNWGNLKYWQGCCALCLALIAVFCTSKLLSGLI